MIARVEVVKALRRAQIPTVAIGPLADWVCDISEAIESDRKNETARSQETSDLDSDNTFLNRMRKQFAGLEKCLSEMPPQQTVLINRLTATSIGRNLSISAFEDIQIPIDTEVSFRVLETRAASESAGPYRVCEDEIRRSRQHAAQRRGNEAITFVIRSLGQRINWQIELLRHNKSPNKGGRPEIPYRGCSIQLLADGFERFTQEMPTETAKGAFANFCTEVFPLLGIETDGIESAIKRVLGKRRNRQSP